MLKRLIQLLLIIRDIFLLPVLYCSPRFSKKILFGAWGGRQYSDNPKYFMLEVLRSQLSFQCYWIGEACVRSQVEATPGVKFIRKGSWRAFWHMLTARYYVCNIDWREDLGGIPTYGRVKIINLWHGIPYKKIGQRQLDGCGCANAGEISFSKIRVWVRNVLGKWNNWCYSDASWTSVSSEKMREIMYQAFPFRFPKERMVMAGLPRNDFLIQNRDNVALQKQLKTKYAELLGVSKDKKWYLYLPTWRHGEGAAFSFMTSINKAKYQAILQEQNAVLIEKQHPIVLRRLNLTGESDSNLFAISETQASLIDMQELLLISDRLITDYSSCFFDFSLLNRPCIHFVYDFKTYVENDSGVEYELSDIAVGPLVETENGLMAAIACTDARLLEQRASQWQETINFETGNASQTLINQCLGL